MAAFLALVAAACQLELLSHSADAVEELVLRWFPAQRVDAVRERVRAIIAADAAHAADAAAEGAGEARAGAD